MKPLLLCCLIPALLVNAPSFGQSKKRYAPILPENVKNGKQLDRADLFTFQQFIEFYVEYGMEVQTKEYGPGVGVHELYKDNEHTYFSYGNNVHVIRLIKIKTEDLARLEYTGINGIEIRKRFIDEVVPEKDKKKVASADCLTAFTNTDFDYKYVEAENKVQITYKWKKNCDFLSKPVNKTYIADYDLESKTFQVIKN